MSVRDTKDPGKQQRVQRSVRLTKEQWRRIRLLEVELETSFQDLAVQGLSLVLKAHGKKPL